MHEIEIPGITPPPPADKKCVADVLGVGLHGKLRFDAREVIVTGKLQNIEGEAYYLANMYFSSLLPAQLKDVATKGNDKTGEPVDPAFAAGSSAGMTLTTLERYTASCRACAAVGRLSRMLSADLLLASNE